MAALDDLLETTRCVYAVGRNYAAHAVELGNQVPEKPLWFMKSAASLACGDELSFPNHLGPIHYELEWAVRIGESLAVADQCRPSSVSHVGLAIDFTARALQSELKGRQHPWMRSKSFKNACWVAGLKPVPVHAAGFRFMLHLNGQLRQKGASELMLFSPMQLIDDLLTFIPLFPGDLILTGTPEGVGPVNSGDHLRVSSPTLGFVRELLIK